MSKLLKKCNQNINKSQIKPITQKNSQKYNQSLVAIMAAKMKNTPGVNK
jgi:hypothetical protein